MLAAALGAKPPRHAPLWLGRLFAGDGLAMMAESRGADSTKAKKELGWTLRYPTWREGFPAAYRERYASYPGNRDGVTALGLLTGLLDAGTFRSWDTAPARPRYRRRRIRRRAGQGPRGHRGR